MKYLLTIIIALFAIGAMAQGRNEYEKKFVEVQQSSGLKIEFWITSDDSKPNRRDRLLYPNGEQVLSLAGLFGYMESIGFELFTTRQMFYETIRINTTPIFLFAQKNDKEFSIIGGRIMVIQ